MKRLALFMLILVLALSACGKAPEEAQSGKSEGVTVSAVTGTAEVLSGGVTSALTVGQTLSESDTVTTGAGSSADIDLMNGKTVYIGENTVFELSAIRRDSSGEVTILSLKQGAVVNVVDTKLGENDVYEVHTPRLVMSVRGTSNVMQSDENGDNVIALTGDTRTLAGGVENSIVPGMQLGLDNDGNKNLMPMNMEDLPPIASGYVENAGVSFTPLSEDEIRAAQEERGLNSELEETVNLSGEPTPAPTVAPTVTPTAEPTVAPTVEPTVEPVVEPVTAPEPENNPVPAVNTAVIPVPPAPAPEILPAPSPTVEPAPAPSPAVEPSPIPAPVIMPSPTPAPSIAPSPSVRPSTSPSPSARPSPSPSPSVSPSPTPEPPAPEPPAPEPPAPEPPAPEPPAPEPPAPEPPVQGGGDEEDPNLPPSGGGDEDDDDGGTGAYTYKLKYVLYSNYQVVVKEKTVHIDVDNPQNGHSVITALGTPAERYMPHNYQRHSSSNISYSGTGSTYVVPVEIEDFYLEFEYDDIKDGFATTSSITIKINHSSDLQFYLGGNDPYFVLKWGVLSNKLYGGTNNGNISKNDLVTKYTTDWTYTIYAKNAVLPHETGEDVITLVSKTQQGTARSAPYRTQVM